MHDRWWEDEPDLGVLCWCGDSIVHVDRDLVKRGKTVACRKRKCKEIALERSRDEGHSEGERSLYR